MKSYHCFAALLLAGCLTSNASATLIAAYNFEGNANDISGNGKNGVVSGATLTTNGFQGQAYEFSGSASTNSGGDRISLPFNINPSVFPQLTMGAWVNSDITGTPSGSIAPKAISHDNGGFDRTLGIDFRDGNSMTTSSEWAAFAGSSVGIVDSDIGVVTDTWVFLAVVYDQSAATVRLHVDGSSITQGGAALGESALNVTIGKNAGFFSNEYWDGRIDNVFFFDEALTTTQIEAIRTDPSSLFHPAPAPGTLALLAIGLTAVRLRQRKPA